MSKQFPSFFFKCIPFLQSFVYIMYVFQRCRANARNLKQKNYQTLAATTILYVH